MDICENSIQNQQQTIDFPGWDKPFTPQELEEIEAALQSASASSSSSSSILSTSQTDNCSATGDSPAENHPKTRRRLPESLFAFRDKLSSECGTMGTANSFSLLPCPRNQDHNRFYSSYQAKLKTRYPAISFGGRIIYSKTVFEVEKAANELLKFVDAKKKDTGRVVMGLDIEWKPSFRKGVPNGKAAVMQICVDNKHCHVMHIIHSGFPESLKSLLGDASAVKVGVGIAIDARKVLKDHSVSMEALEDLSFLANQKLGGERKNWSLTSLTEALISKQLPKPNNIRLGNWESYPLSKKQLKYAATDAYVSWYLHRILDSLPDAAAVDTSELVENVAQS